ncbi:MAG: hypothetical protein JNK35_05300 [Phycisphaerae bacterium]|nr:hypothetical protein [Phycisphaerae bacterium]
MSARVSRNNLKAGVLLVGSLLAGLAIALQLGNVIGMLTERRATYVFRFSLADGAMGLKKGSMIKVGGQPVGEVSRVTFERPADAKDVPPLEIASGVGPEPKTHGNGVAAPDEGRSPPTAVYVIASIRRDLVLYRDARVYLELPLLGSVSTINIPDIGGGTYQEPASNPTGTIARKVAPLEPNEIIPGTLAPPTFLGQAGYGPEQKEQLQIILQRGKEISNQVSEMVGSAKSQLDGTLGSLKAAAEQINDATGRVNTRLPDWLELITQALVNTRSATGEAEQRLIQAKALIATVQQAIDDNRAVVDRILSNTERATANVATLTDKVNTELYGTVKDTLADGRRALGAFAEVGEKAAQFVTEKTPELGRIVANARLSADQMKLMMTEVRRNPWRLLYQPTRREIEEELTYDAARTYAEAVGQLRAASDALQAVLSAGSTPGGGGTPPDRAQIDEITRTIRESFGRYQDAERRFLDRLVSENK